MKKIFLLCFLLALLSSCVGTVGSGSNLSHKVQVFIVPFHSDSRVRTASGRPPIRDWKGGPKVCRFRPFRLEDVRDRLIKEGVNKNVLDKFLFDETFETEGGGEGESEGNSFSRREVGRPVYHEVGENWLSFGLQITNDTPFLLVIDNIRFQAKARCGSQTFEHSGEISTGYCSGEGEGATPYLYLVPPLAIGGKQVNYYSKSPNPFDNLTLFFDGFPILDRTGEASPDLQSTVKAFGANTTGQTNNVSTSATGTEKECQPHKIKVIPIYRVELTLIGYFILPRGDDKDDREDEVEQVNSFVKRVSFSTTVFN